VKCSIPWVILCQKRDSRDRKRGKKKSTKKDSSKEWGKTRGKPTQATSKVFLLPAGEREYLTLLPHPRVTRKESGTTDERIRQMGATAENLNRRTLEKKKKEHNRDNHKTRPTNMKGSSRGDKTEKKREPPSGKGRLIKNEAATKNGRRNGS